MDAPIIKQIKEIAFSVISPEIIKKIAVAKIVTPELYDMDGYPVDGGLMDLRLGAIDPGVRCRTCGGSVKECLGHFGYIELARPVLHIKFVDIIEFLLRSTCQQCGRLMTKKEKIDEAELKRLKNVKKCPYCNAKQEKIKLDKPYFFYKGNKRFYPNEIREHLLRIPDEDLQKLGIDPKAFRPEWAVITLLLVPPVTVRPSITLETGERSEDDLTHKISDIVRTNQRVWENINAGAPEVIIEDLWDLLQYHVATYIDNNISQLPPARHRGGQPLKTLTERIKGKEGHIRHNLAGKRVNFSARTVISPDPKIAVNEVGVPIEVARVLTVPERVTAKNIEYLKALVLSKSYPGANYIVRPDGKRKKITDETREDLAEELDIGYVVERHLQDGDIVLFNRHPSLHKASLMAHYVKILPGRTFRISPASTFPYNADFDGDEMNIHAPQTEEALAEARILMDIQNMLISPKNNTPLLGSKDDAVTGNFLLTQTKLTKQEALQLLAEADVSTEKILKAANEFGDAVSGKQVFSAVLPPIDFEAKTKLCLGKDCPYYSQCKKEKCPNNAYVKIKKGKLVAGIVDKSIIGVEKSELIKAIDAKFGRRTAIEVVEAIFKLGIAYLSKKGFTLSPVEFEPTQWLREETKKVIAKARQKVEQIIDAYNKGNLEILPGKTAEETREVKILQVLNQTRTEIGKHAEKLPMNNAMIMMRSGAKGNIVLNLTQMNCFVGQQTLWAKRISIGFTARTLSFFKQHDLSPEARGFIASSFYDGLKPYEFFFAAMLGRDSLMDTALRTPKSGYLYRRLLNALQDLRVEYDGSVRDGSGNIIQFAYGGDLVDVSKKHLSDKTIEPAEAIGVVTAQSFGEPATQMTLNVFHFAGVSEMQVTVGLPRLIEIFDARKQPSTPSMEIYVEHDYNNEEKVKRLAERIKQVKLEDIASEINIDFSDKKITIIFDKKAMRDKAIKPDAILEAIKMKGIKKRLSDDKLTISCGELTFREIYRLKEKIRNAIVGGVPGIEQVLIVKRQKDYVILTSGSNLKEVMKLKGVDKTRTITNNIFEIAEVLGIEAARQAIVNEVIKVINQQGLDIDIRHIKLVADAMTSSGEIKGVTRLGIISDKSSVLARASFEIPIRQFVDAGMKGTVEKLNSVVENLILNQPVPVGTGLPGLLVTVEAHDSLVKPLQEQKRK